ncbi:MAG TPA: GTPase [Gammaproteobacteria bacterium]|nr:GTPase [Gammaproteobacteria bacterium]
MRVDRLVRVLLALVIALVLLAVIATALFVTESAFAVWDRLRAAPRWLFWFYVSALGAAVIGSGWLIWRLLRPHRSGASVTSARPPGESELHARIAAAEAAGLDVGSVRAELAALGERRESGRVYAAFFGEISTGKSALIRALVPGAEPDVDVRGGSTRSVGHYRWRSPAGDELILADVPGSNEPGGALEAAAQEEAQRAHVVVYVCDGDLTRDQLQRLEALRRLGKPVVLALNKSDRYTADELETLRERLAAQTALGNGEPLDVAIVSAGGTGKVVERHADGSERTVERAREPEVAALLAALQRRLDADPRALETLRDTAVFLLAARKLEAVEAHYRRARAGDIVRSYTKKAVVGALAAVTPGTDVLIQGFLGTSLVRELCALYNAPARNLDIEQFLDLSRSKVGKALPILLAIAGNGFKAFPGVGTVAGGLVHAVAYGLIFDALGASLVDTLEVRGELKPAPAAARFEENLHEDFSTRARALVKIALAANKDRPRSD